MKKLLMATAFAFLSISTAKADADYLPQLDVHYGDLNLKSHSGAKIALRRIKSAASDVCGGVPDTLLDLTAYGLYKNCTLDAIDEAVQQLHAPLVTSLYMSQSEDTRVALSE